MQEHYPETGRSLPAEEGDASHWAAASTLAGGEPAPGDKADNGIILNGEMIAGAWVFAKDVLSKFHTSGIAVECKIQALRIHELSEGTVDCFAFNKGAKELYIWDYKYGYKLVNVFENWQLINYAIGVIDRMCPGELEQQVRVIMTVVQPRPYHPQGSIRRWSVKASDLRGYANKLHMAAHEALGPEPSIKSGPWCLYCRAALNCPSNNAASMAAIDVTYRAEPCELDNSAISAQLAILRRASDAMKNRLSALEAQAEIKIKKGEIVPGWGLSPGNGQRSWSRPEAEVLALGDLMGINLASPMTPFQAEKAGVPQDLVAAYSSRSAGAMKLTPDDGSQAKQIFGGT